MKLAHQWLGFCNRIKPGDLWLSEGFATYFAGLFLERYEGREAFDEYMRRQEDSLLGYEKQHPSPIHDTQTTDLLRLLNANNYQKGAWVLHMLRGAGDEKVFRRTSHLLYEIT